MKLYELTKDIKEINDLIESGEIEANDALDTLESLDLAVKQKGTDITALLLNEEASIKALKEAEEKIANRRKRKQNKIEWLKQYLLENMEANGIQSLESPEFAVSLVKNPPKVELIEDAEKLLHDKYGDRFIRSKTTISVNRKELLEAMKKGEEITGAKIVQSNRLKFS
tara:strand:- start:449 stop:955 length:507 start_codon:yes stop_codon:yes gene_type:complete